MSWAEFIKEESEKEYYKVLMSFLDDEYATSTVFPRRENLFRAFDLTPLNTVKAVIVGQDPYHSSSNGIPWANGLAFAVNDDIKPPPSLRNIMKEYSVSDKTLESLAKQGILFLNTVLTVRAGEPYSHSNHGWETFTDNALKYLTDYNPELVFILWGRHAQQKRFPCKARFSCAHPSPLGASRSAPIPFFGSSVNVKNAIPEIKWN